MNCFPQPKTEKPMNPEEHVEPEKPEKVKFEITPEGLFVRQGEKEILLASRYLPSLVSKIAIALPVKNRVDIIGLIARSLSKLIG